MTVQQENDPFSIQLQSAVPLIEQRLSTLESQLAMSASQNSHKMDEILNHISDISTGRAPLNINITIPAGANYQVPTITTTTSSPHTYDASLSASSTSLAATASSSASQALMSNETNVPTYRMSRGSTTLLRLWKEWHDGLGGGHSVQWMDENCPGWFVNDKTFYSRRRRTIMAIKKYAIQHNLRETTALDIAEARRQQMGKSVDFFSKNQELMFEDE
ncbi:hypothetical protein [Parasitella parasitica]|uniref:Transcription activator GCR1-like domain-containing protein n=1 Tax=Parasitella parasitica TaxID=35722 RepID=A0A0B7NGK9_9FUNG|nr:hypothetical protein [Parasitella parasitica]